MDEGLSYVQCRHKLYVYLATLKREQRQATQREKDLRENSVKRYVWRGRGWAYRNRHCLGGDSRVIRQVWLLRGTVSATGRVTAL